MKDKERSKVIQKKERILAKKPSERTEKDLYFLRRFKLQGTDVSHPSRIALSQTQEIAVRVMRNSLYLLSLSGYSLASLNKYFAGLNIYVDLGTLDSFYRDGKRLSMSLYVPILLSNHFGVSVLDMLFTDLSVEGNLPVGWVAKPLV